MNVPPLSKQTIVLALLAGLVAASVSGVEMLLAMLVAILGFEVLRRKLMNPR